MHASFVIFEEKNGKISSKDIEKLQELAYPRDPRKIRAISFKNGVKTLTKLIELIPKYKISQNLQKIQGSFPKICEKLLKFVEPSKKFRNILCHGDLWINNLMFKYEAEKPIECKIIDFQLTRFAPPAMDLATFVYSSSNREFRKIHLNEILKIYCDMFENELKA
jgi:thiamine kinase-like enzyme